MRRSQPATPSAGRLAWPSRRIASLSICAMLALALLGARAPSAMSAGLGAGSPLGELAERQQETTSTRTTASTAATESNSTSNSPTVVILALGAAAALLVAIAFVIVRDAHKVAPVADGQMAAGGSGGNAATRLRRRRAKAKAARRQRKRNR